MSYVKISTVDTTPQLDPYRRLTNEVTRTMMQLWVDEEGGRLCVIDQRNSGRAMNQSEYFNCTLTCFLDADDLDALVRPQEEQLRDYLNSTRGQELLNAIFAGHEIVWDGNRQIGKIDKNVKNLIEIIQLEIFQIANKTMDYPESIRSF